MINMIQPVPGAAQSAAASGVSSASRDRQTENEAPTPSQRPVMDEYIPEEKQEPSGRYWLDRDENGQPKVYFDDPEKGGNDEETCTGNTDKVDREIESLKKEQEELKRQLQSETDATKAAALEKELAQVERELSQKDNDTYRRQHTMFS